jgi:hypothetical protein
MEAQDWGFAVGSLRKPLWRMDAKVAICHVVVGMACHATMSIHCLKPKHIGLEGVSKHAVQSQGIADLRSLKPKRRCG